MIQAVLVSDEVIEPVEAEQIPDGDGFMFPNDLGGDGYVGEATRRKRGGGSNDRGRYRRRERVWMVTVAVLIVVVITLVLAAVMR